MVFDVIMEFIANSPPALCILGSILLWIMGEEGFAAVLLFVGVILQILWLVMKKNR